MSTPEITFSTNLAQVARHALSVTRIAAVREDVWPELAKTTVAFRLSADGRVSVGLDTRPQAESQSVFDATLATRQRLRNEDATKAAHEAARASKHNDAGAYNMVGSAPTPQDGSLGVEDDAISRQVRVAREQAEKSTCEDVSKALGFARTSYDWPQLLRQIKFEAETALAASNRDEAALQLAKALGASADTPWTVLMELVRAQGREVNATKGLREDISEVLGGPGANYAWSQVIKHTAEMVEHKAKAGESAKPSNFPRLSDRADGVAGHYAIERVVGRRREFIGTKGDWVGYGAKVFTLKEAEEWARTHIAFVV